MKLPICVALIALLSACIPIGIRGTSNVDGGVPHPVAVSPSGDAAPSLPASRARDPQRA